MKPVLRIFFIIIIAALALHSPAQAFQFENYRWGTTPNETKIAIEDHGKQLLSSSGGRFLTYSDKIMEEPCTVTFEFTPKTKALASIKISWNDRNIGNDVKKLLTEKYGTPSQPELFSEEYYWYAASAYDAIVLKYDYAGTVLTYFGGTYQQKYEEEFDSLASEEKKRF